jgi:exopolyphosphatase/guanosine-5'-triphosphate,3'-diphosphate pyrophosphatase
LGRVRGPVAIVDIGSNSVRLVTYETLLRTAAILHNEKSICGIGRNMVTTHRLHDGGIAMALGALSRFRLLADSFGIRHRIAVATAAARDATNGPQFIAAAEAAWGSPVRVLSGEEEAKVAAEGVLAGIPDAVGLVGDLGGGSLDMVTVGSGVAGAAMTLPFGPLRLMDAARQDPERARAIVDVGLEGLEGLEALPSLKGRSFYAVGGTWRALARVDMDREAYPLHVLHHYTIPAARALKLCRALSGLSRKTLDKMGVISRRRAEALPYGAVVLERLLLATGLKDVVISAYGLREGLLHGALSREEREKDPLLEFSAAANQRMSRAPAHAGELFAFSQVLFEGEGAASHRLRRAACDFSDIGWRRHPDDRAVGSFEEVLTAPFAGAGHRDRAILATTVFHRYKGDDDPPLGSGAHDLLTAEDQNLARRMGLVARLGFALSGCASGELTHYRFKLTPGRLFLQVPASRQAMVSDPVPKRLSALAAAFGRKGEISLL